MVTNRSQSCTTNKCSAQAAAEPCAGAIATVGPPISSPVW